MGRAAEDTGSVFAEARMIIENKYKHIATLRARARMLNMAAIAAVTFKGFTLLLPLRYGGMFPKAGITTVVGELVANLLMLCASPGSRRERLSVLKLWSVACTAIAFQVFLAMYSYHVIWETPDKYFVLAGQVARKELGIEQERAEQLYQSFETGMDCILFMVLLARWSCVHSMVVGLISQKKERDALAKVKQVRNALAAEQAHAEGAGEEQAQERLEPKKRR